MKITFYGGAKTVTGANHYLEIGEKKILIDCGMLQGEDFVEQFNYEPFPYNPAEIDYLFVTHAHIDHVGRIPKLIKEGFKGKVIATTPTVELAKLSLRDSARIIAHEAKELKRDPFFTMKDVEKSDKFWVKHSYHDVIEVGDGITVEILSAGHVLGSSMYKISAEGKTITFTGDLGNVPAPLIGPPDLVGKTDYLVIESVYGDRNHDPARIGSKLLKEIVIETINRGGTLVIPSFALERTQILLFYLNNMIEANQIPHVPVYLDSPLAIKMTEVFRKQSPYFKKAIVTQIQGGDKVFSFPGLHMTKTSDESKQINDQPGPKIIIAGNGMSTGGRILFHEMKYLSDPKNTILIVGYQAQHSLGRSLLEGKKEVRIHHQRIKVKADIHQITAFSAHADQRQLIEFVQKNVDGVPSKIFVVQGEEIPAENLVSQLEKRGYDAYAPNYKESFEL